MRKRAYKIIRGTFHVPVGMELFSAQPQPSEEVSANYLISSDVVIFIISEHQGTIAKNGMHYVEFEYDMAVKNNIPFIVIAHENLKPLHREGQHPLLLKTKDENQIKFFSDEGDLTFEVSEAIKDFEKKYCSLYGYVSVALYTELLKELKEALRNIEKIKKVNDVHLNAQSILSANFAHRVVISKGVSANVKEGAVAYGNQLRSLLDLLNRDFGNRPLLLEIASDGIERLYSTLQDITSPRGYTPRDNIDFASLVEKLFSDRLNKLQATSIVSEEEKYENFSAYWDDPEFKGIFQKKNMEALSRESCSIERIYICDSLISAVRTEWFKTAALPQAGAGAHIKLCPIDHGDGKSYKDYGIYFHSENDQDLGTYVLEAPDEENRESRYLKIRLLSEHTEYYKNDFEILWNNKKFEAIEIFHNTNAPPDIREFGVGTINDVIENNAILRDLILLSNKRKISSSDLGFVRKNDRIYAEIIKNFIDESYGVASSFLYFGDTLDNDGAVIRHLQEMNMPIFGFICEPRLNIGNVFINGVMHADAWHMAVKFLRIISERGISFNENMLAIFDIDQTLWAPKGLADTPISESRMDAINDILGSCFDDTEAGDRSRERSRQIMASTYSLLGQLKYNLLTSDNEDFKAAVSIFLGLGLYHREKKTDMHVFEQYRPDSDWELENILNYYTKLGGIGTFIMDAFSETYHGKKFCETHGIIYDRVFEIVDVLMNNLRDGKPAPFEHFRSRELESTILRTKESDISQAITINKVMRDIGMALKQAGVKILALSDRPDEATYSDTVSLLQTPMKIFGHDLYGEIREIVGGRSPK